MDKRVDRRIKYTKMVVEESLLRLLKEKNISKVTVKEICELADVNRATFYAHYKDQYDLLEQMESSIIGKIREYVFDGYDSLSDKAALEKRIEAILAYLQENHEFCNVLLGNNVSGDFRDKVIDVLKEEITSKWIARGVSSMDYIDYLYTFTAVGSVGVIKKWLQEGMKSTPGEVAKFIVSITVHISPDVVE